LRLSGVVPPLVTPFLPDGSVDHAAFEANLASLAAADLAGFLVLGSNGEAAALDEGEKLDLVAAARRAAPGRFLLAGAGTESTRGTIALVRKVADLGADAVLILTPHFYRGRMSEEALRRHFTAIADASPVSVYLYSVPAFTGLGAPYWDAHARGAIFGLTRATGPADIVRAALEAVCYQTRDLLEAMAADGAQPPRTLRVDGGMVANDWVLQCLADTLDCAVERPEVSETTALGAASLAGLKSGFYAGLDGVAATWRSSGRFEPKLGAEERARRYAGWLDAVARVRSGD